MASNESIVEIQAFDFLENKVIYNFDEINTAISEEFLPQNEIPLPQTTDSKTPPKKARRNPKTPSAAQQKKSNKELIKNSETSKYQKGEIKPARALKPPCNSPLCKKAANRHCYDFTEAERNELFAYFWSLSREQKETYMAAFVTKVPLKVTTVPTKLDSRRSGTVIYRLKKNNNGEAMQVCKKMFMNTFGLNEWFLYRGFSYFEGGNEMAKPKQRLKRSKVQEVELEKESVQ